MMAGVVLEAYSCRVGPGLLLALLVWCCMGGAARGDFASDQKECTDSLIGLSTCLTYVEGSAKAPTPDCCSGLRQVVGKSNRCLCILIKDRNEPALGFKIDANRAMALPSVCGNPVNITQCIDLLKLDPKSKDAEVFMQFGNTTKQGNASGAPGSRSSSSSSPAAIPKDSNGGVGRSRHLGWRRWVGVEVVGGLWASCAVFLSLMVLGG